MPQMRMPICLATITSVTVLMPTISAPSVFGSSIAIFMIYVRFQLAGFKRGAPGKLISLYVIQLVALFAYTLVASVTIHIPWSEIFNFSIIPSLIVSIVMIFVNRYYYSKRAHLFVN